MKHTFERNEDETISMVYCKLFHNNVFAKLRSGKYLIITTDLEMLKITRHIIL